ncbi:hypothetical protein GCM10027592_50700 [Spirosoma flavus]
MQLTVTPENLLEWIALRTNLVPIPLLHAQIMPVLAKAVLEAADKGIFEAARSGAKTLAELNETLQLNEKALGEVMGLLTAMGYFTYRKERFKLTRMARRFALIDDPRSVHGLIVFNNRVTWDWMNHLGEYLQTGKGIQYHDTFTPEQWHYYQQGMVAASNAEIQEFGRRVPLPKSIRSGQAATLLDIGGSHGNHAVALCRKYPNLTATLLDLPQAIEQAAPVLAKQQMGSRVQHQVGNALTDNFGENAFDLILMSNVAHHFTPEENQHVTNKVARALRPNGLFIINEFIRPDMSAPPELVGSSTNLFYGLSSTAGNYSVAEIQTWYRVAGLTAYKEVWYQTIPGRAMVVAKK